MELTIDGHTDRSEMIYYLRSVVLATVVTKRIYLPYFLLKKDVRIVKTSNCDVFGEIS